MRRPVQRGSASGERGLEGRITGFENVVEVQDQTVRLTHPPEGLVYFES